MLTTFHLSLTTHLPTWRSSIALNVLHSHSTMILLNPLVISHQPISDSSSTTPGSYGSPKPTTTTVETMPPTTYEITDSVPLLFGLWSTAVKYTSTFENTENGVNTTVVAPMGILSLASWTISEKTLENDNVVVEVNENVEVRCNWLLVPFVQATMRSAHQDLHRRLVEFVKQQEEGDHVQDEVAH